MRFIWYRKSNARVVSEGYEVLTVYKSIFIRPSGAPQAIGAIDAVDNDK